MYLIPPPERAPLPTRPLARLNAGWISRIVRQGYCDNWLGKIREARARRVGGIRRRAAGAASGRRRWSVAWSFPALPGCLARFRNRRRRGWEIVDALMLVVPTRQVTPIAPSSVTPRQARWGPHWMSLSAGKTGRCAGAKR